MNGEDAYVSMEDMAIHLSLSPPTFRRWVRDGIVPQHTYIKVGQTYRFNKGQVVGALQKNTADKPAVDAPTQLELDFGDDD